MTRISENYNKNISDSTPVIAPVPAVAGPPVAVPIVRIKFPSDRKKQQVIDLLADFVAREGEAFEEVKQILFSRKTSEFPSCIVFHSIRFFLFHCFVVVSYFH
jgi:hypothetical protein